MITHVLTPEKIANLLREEELISGVTVTRCARCPDWQFVGPAEDGHFAFLLHQSTHKTDNVQK